MKRAFTLEYWLDDGWYVGKLKEIPGVFSQGETLEELEENIEDAYKLLMDYANPTNGKLTPDPRHSEIKESLCRLIKGHHW